MYSKFFIILKIFFIIVICSSVSFALSDKLQDIANQAFNAHKSKQYEESYELFGKLLSQGSKELTKNQIEHVKDLMLLAAYEVTNQKTNQKDLKGAMKWIDKGLSLGLFKVNNKISIYYPMLLACKGLGFYETEKYEDSFNYLIKAKRYIDIAGEDDNYTNELKKVLKQKIEEALDAIKTETN